jgi:hypothetical protein
MAVLSSDHAVKDRDQAMIKRKRLTPVTLVFVYRLLQFLIQHRAYAMLDVETAASWIYAVFSLGQGDRSKPPNTSWRSTAKYAAACTYTMNCIG